MSGAGGGTPELSSLGTQESLIQDQPWNWVEQQNQPIYGPSQYNWGLKPPKIPLKQI